MSRKFYKDGEEVGDITERLNLTSSDQDWLSLRPSSATRYFKDNYFGELNEKNIPHGRGIYIFSSGRVYIGYFNNGDDAPGNFINISDNSEFEVSKRYLDEDGRLRLRGTTYDADGLRNKF